MEEFAATVVIGGALRQDLNNNTGIRNDVLTVTGQLNLAANHHQVRIGVQARR